MFYIYLTDRNGQVVDDANYDTIEELLRDYPYAEYQGDGTYQDWVGGYRI